MSHHWRFTKIPENTPLDEVIRIQNLNMRDLAGVLAAIPLSCYGNPEGSIEGSTGDLCVRLDGSAGSTFYVKESGQQTLTGWVAK